MAFEDDLEPDLLHEAPFFLTAAVVYAGALLVNPVVQWGSGRGPAEKSVPVEFVAQLPAPSPNLAPMQGEGKTDAPPQKGEGEYKPEKVQEGAADAPPKPLPKPKPAAVPSPRHKPAATLAKPKPAAKPKPVPDVKAIMARSMARREKLDHDKALKAAAVAAEQARAQALRQEKARRAEEARVAAEKRASAERARQAQLAAERAAKAKKKAELSRQLATMNDPDEALDAGGGAAAPAARGGRAADRAAAAAALAETAESPDAGDAAGSGGGDLLDAKAKGGGTGPDGEGVSWSLDGPVGSRRVLARAVPASPDWVGTRGLDLTVTVRFQVLPDGSVRPGAVIQKTSGFPEIDRRALDALRRWRFEAVPAGGAQTWGRVTFRFTS